MIALAFRRLSRYGVAPLLFSLVVLLLAGCSEDKPTFVGSDISGTHLGRGLSLTDMDGKPFTDKSFEGKVTLVFFGFTQCPDVCPTTLAELTEVLKQLGDQANKVQMLMITVDPERDTPDVLTALARLLSLHSPS
jgi:protein SCO1/2